MNGTGSRSTPGVGERTAREAATVRKVNEDGAEINMKNWYTVRLTLAQLLVNFFFVIWEDRTRTAYCVMMLATEEYVHDTYKGISVWIST